MNWPVQQQMGWAVKPIDEQEGPSMHIIPLNPCTREPVLYHLENRPNLPAITTNGRLSWLTGTDNCIQEIHSRIEERYPNKQYSGVQTYVMCGVMVKQLDKDQVALVFEIWGFWEHFRELDDLYNTLYSLGEKKVGDAHWNQIIQYLANDPVKTWINTLIDFLKKELNWKDYVAQFLERM